MNGLASGKHRDKVFDAPGSCVASLGAVDSVQHGVSVLAREELEVGLRLGLAGQRRARSVGTFVMRFKPPTPSGDVGEEQLTERVDHPLSFSSMRASSAATRPPRRR
jgi:hypothetical protein